MNNITPRTRISINTGLQEAKDAAIRPPMQKISLDMPIEDWRAFKEKCVKERVSMSSVFRQLIRDYAQESK